MEIRMNIVDRVKRILVSPATEWPVIAAEATPTAALITGYVLPLAAVSALAAFIGNSFVGISVPMMSTTYRMPVTAGLVAACWTVAMAVVGVFICGFVINAFAPTFGGQKNDAQAMKVAAYSFTPSWVAGILQIIPMLGMLAILGGLYALYLLYLGLPVLMKSPEDKTIGYTLAVIVSMIVVMIVLGAVGAMILGVGAMGAGAMGARPY
jgi:hypothetical protein